MELGTLSEIEARFFHAAGNVNVANYLSKNKEQNDPAKAHSWNSGIYPLAQEVLT
jgi:hypothetical protein